MFTAIVSNSTEALTGWNHGEGDDVVWLSGVSAGLYEVWSGWMTLCEDIRDFDKPSTGTVTIVTPDQIVATSCHLQPIEIPTGFGMLRDDFS
jgi:hypothetical protein